MSEFSPTHHIIRMTYGQTKGSQSPMWRCETREGDRVNIFQHNDPDKNTARFFSQYLSDMQGLTVGQVVTWEQHPIPVVMRQDGPWWEVVAVADRAADVVPDPVYVPDAQVDRAAAALWAAYLFKNVKPEHVCFWDTETTGTSDKDEIIQMGIVDGYGNVLLDQTFKPTRTPHPEALAVNGLTPEVLRISPAFVAFYSRIVDILSGHIWVIYNVAFDVRLLQQTCRRYDLPLIPSIGVNCAMDMFSLYYGEWNPVHQQYVSKRLELAAETLHVEVMGHAHDAVSDALTTQKIVAAMAGVHRAQQVG